MLKDLNKTTADIIVNKIMDEELIKMEDVRKLVDFEYDIKMHESQSRNHQKMPSINFKAKSCDKGK